MVMILLVLLYLIFLYCCAVALVILVVVVMCLAFVYDVVISHAFVSIDVVRIHGCICNVVICNVIHDVIIVISVVMHECC